MEKTESQLTALLRRKRLRKLLIWAAAAALLAGTGVEFGSAGAQAAQDTPSGQPAKAEPETVPAPERLPAQAAEPATAPDEIKPAVEAGSGARSGASAEAGAASGETPVAAQCASLLKMATDLKAEVDKTTKDQLSVTVVRRAGEIEQLARTVRDTTKNQRSKN